MEENCLSFEFDNWQLYEKAADEDETQSKGMRITEMPGQIAFFLQGLSDFVSPEPREVQVVEVSRWDVKDCYQAKQSHHLE